MTNMQWLIWSLAAAGKFFEGYVVFMTGVALPLISREFGIFGSEAEGFFNALDRDEGPTAYLFACRHCDNTPSYIDCP